MNLRMQPSIDNLLEVLAILLPPEQTFHLLLGFFPSSCKRFVKELRVLDSYSKVDDFNLIRYFDLDFVGDKET
jgi:hypothetical protein